MGGLLAPPASPRLSMGARSCWRKGGVLPGCVARPCGLPPVLSAPCYAACVIYRKRLMLMEVTRFTVTIPGTIACLPPPQRGPDFCAFNARLGGRFQGLPYPAG